MVEVCRAITKHHYMITSIRDVARIVKESFHIASTGRPGPVLIDFPKELVLPIVAVIVLCLAARLFAVGAPIIVAGRALGLQRGAWKILTWGGLRGGISVALAFSLPEGPHRETVLALTFAVVWAGVSWRLTEASQANTCSLTRLLSAPTICRHETRNCARRSNNQGMKWDHACSHLRCRD